MKPAKAARVGALDDGEAADVLAHHLVGGVAQRRVEKDDGGGGGG